MEDCLFCKFVNKEIKTEIVYEDEHVLAFKDINPVAPVHILVIPKVHIANVQELDDENALVLPYVFKAIKKIAKEQGIAEKGYRIINNVGKDGGQTIYHMHFHLIGGVTLNENLV